MENCLLGVGGDRYGLDMRWDHLFDDLAGQLEHELQSEEADLRHEEERLRLGRLPMRDRLVALRASSDVGSARIRCRLRSGEVLRLGIVTVGRDWMAGDVGETPGRDQAIVPFSAVEALMLDPAQATISLEPLRERSELAARLGIAFLLRDLCRRRATVMVRTLTGDATGTIDRVGRDHLDLAEHDRDRLRRAPEVQQVRVIPLDQVLLVRV
ncbi:MAG: hypothetical protein K2X36_02830 [Microbacteriaceae bacterium]|nr:hypothetical protein [Microbacteriaceae bacterium]